MMKWILPAGIAASLCLSVQPINAQELVFGAYMGPKHAFIAKALSPALQELAGKEDGASQWRLATGGQLLNGKGTLDGLRGGLADAGAIVPSFFRSELPTSAMLFDYIGPTNDVVAATGAMLELMLKNCPSCLQEYQDSNARFLAGISSSPNVLMCDTEVTSLADIKGKKVRAVGFLARIAETLGAVPVNMSPPDGMTGIQRGTIDCAMGPASWLVSYGYQDVVTHILNYPFGFSLPLSYFVMNEGAWERMSPAQQKALWAQMPSIVARGVIDGYLVPDEATLEQVEAQGITVTAGGSDITDALADYLANEDQTVVAAAKSLGVTNGEEILQAYQKLLPKWEKLSAEIGRDLDKFSSALAENVYTPLDQ